MSSIDARSRHAPQIWRRLSDAGEFVRALQGWRRIAFAWAVGLLSALAFAPIELFPFLLLAFAALVLIIDGAHTDAHPLRSAAFAGWAFGFGHFLAGLYWVGYAFTVDPSAHAWQIPFVVTLLPGGLALFPAAACAAAVALWRRGASRIFVFAGVYAVAEWSRGHLLTGFPWNLAAYGWGASLAVLQSAALTGAYGLTLLTILFGASLAQLAGTEKRAWLLPLIVTGLFAAIWAGGSLRLAIAPHDNVAGVRLRLVQPDVPQDEKYLPQYRLRNWRRLIDLSSAGSPTHVIWPEAAPPFLVTRIPAAMDQIAVLTANDRVLMTGAVRVLASSDNGYRYFNSFYIFGRGGELLGTYDKFHLVPFGEYLPMEHFLGALGISKLVASPGRFTAGDGPHTYSVPGAPPVGPMLCYEIIFPGAVIGKKRPGWFVNVTDDSWFGPSSGPYQHLLTARVRAIEEGIPVARSANTGISAIIDPFGRIVTSLGLGKLGKVDGPLPRALPMTPYARLGDIGFLALLFACGILAQMWKRPGPVQTA